jgi:phosphate/sulfate permease
LIEKKKISEREERAILVGLIQKNQTEQQVNEYLDELAFLAETAGAITLFLTEALKIPVSTTHTITGSIIGVGATKRLSAVRWGVTVNLLWAWILTIPISGLLAALFFMLIKWLS